MVEENPRNGSGFSASGGETGKPQLILRGSSKTFLSVWISDDKVKIVVSRKGDGGGYERLDTFVVDTDYVLYKFLEYSHDSFRRKCGLASNG